MSLPPLQAASVSITHVFSFVIFHPSRTFSLYTSPIKSNSIDIGGFLIRMSGANLLAFSDCSIISDCDVDSLVRGRCWGEEGGETSKYLGNWLGVRGGYMDT
jgi:hypothetical protein